MGMGSAVIRPMLRAFDDLPVHTRQLAEMFRKHGRVQQRNVTDVQDLDARGALDRLDSGWRTDGPLPDDIVAAGHGNRPDPSSYLDADYITAHLDRFRDGASRIYVTSSLDDWGPGNGGVTFVFPTSELRAILDETGGDARALATRLGMDADYFIDRAGDAKDVQIRRFDPSELSGLRLPDGNEGGANPQWIPGGHLPTGIPEAVIDIPIDATGLRNSPGTPDPSLWPGRPEPLTLHT